MRFTRIVLALAVSCVAALSAAQTAQKPKFEVASIKPNKPGSLNTSIGLFPGCRFLANNETVKEMVYDAYRLSTGQYLPFDHVIGGPRWIETDHFDVEAKPSSDTDSIPQRRLLLMEQSLLEERFQLRTHWSKQDFPVYDLVVAREGLKLTRSQNQPAPPVPNSVRRCSPTPVSPPSHPPSAGSLGATQPRPHITYGVSGVSIDNISVSLTTLIGIVQPYMDRPVINRTGLTGFYDVKMRFSPERVGGAPVASTGPSAGQAGPPDAAEPSGISGPSIFTAIQELGLKLEPAKAPLDVLVIDSVSPPSEN